MIRIAIDTRWFLRWVFVFCFPFCSESAFAQSPFYHYFQDTILPGYRISGSLDSSDCYAGLPQHTLPNFLSPSVSLFSLSDLNSNYGSTAKRRFSAIPHVGLIYSIGSKATQFGGISYTQALDSFTFVQFDYKRLFSNGILRQGGYEQNSVNFNFLYRKNRIATEIAIRFKGDDSKLNGGTVGDSLIGDFDLIFQPVEKESTSNSKRYFSVDWNNFLSFTKDSLIKTGFFLSPRYKIYTNKYLELGDIKSIYGQFNYDSTSTRDSWGRTEIGAYSGYFLHTKTVKLNVGAVFNYWDFDNLIQHTDTLEARLKGQADLTLKSGWSLLNSASLNLLGALGEADVRTVLIKSGKALSFSAYADFKRAFPDSYQRAYYGNAIQYGWINKELTTQLETAAQLEGVVFRVPFSISGKFLQVSKPLLFVDNTWRQDTLSNLSVASLVFKSNFKWRAIFVQPKIHLQFTELNFVPNLQAMVRLGFNGTLFKAKKLKTVIGVDLGYTSEFALLDYTPMMDAFSPSNSVFKFNAMPKLNVFTQFDLGYFRWFVRFENIEQFWQKNVNFEALGYPVVPFQFRFGVSWDLFN